MFFFAAQVAAAAGVDLGVVGVHGVHGVQGGGRAGRAGRAPAGAKLSLLQGLVPSFFNDAGNTPNFGWFIMEKYGKQFFPSSING